MITDRIPAGTIFAGASNGGTLIGDEVRWNINSIAPSASTGLSLVVRVGAVLSGTVITNDHYGVRSDQTTEPVLGLSGVVVVYNNLIPRVWLPLVGK